MLYKINYYFALKRKLAVKVLGSAWVLKMEGYMCDFWLPGGSAAKRQRVINNPDFKSVVTVNPAVQQPPSPVSPQHLHAQLQRALIENALLKEKISSLEEKLTASRGKVFTKGKPFSS